MSRHVGLRVAIPFIAMLAPVALAEIALRLAGPGWLRERMRAMAAGTVVAGEANEGAAFGEWHDGKFLGFRPGTIFKLIDPEFVATVHITDRATRVTGTEDAGGMRVAFAGDSFTFGYGVDDRDVYASSLC